MSTNNENHYGGITDNNQNNRFLINRLNAVQQLSELQLDQIKRLTRIGTALSAEKKLDRLLEMIVDEARKFTNADAGTLYIMSDDEKELHFAIVQNSSLAVRMGGSGGKIAWPPVRLRNSDGSPNNANVSAYVAVSGETINIADVYHARGFNFAGTKKFDRSTGYRSKSMLVVPLRNHENDIIGVLQLLNALDPKTGEVIKFSPEYQEMILSLASQAAVALSNNRLIHDLENLLESFIRTIATAIDEKSPYTGGHVRRVAELTMTMAHKINDINYGKFADIKFSDDQLRELRLAAWLHDVGKITTPEYVVDKATKLESVYDRIHDVKTRIGLIQKDYATVEGKDKRKDKTTKDKDAAYAIKVLEEEYQFLSEVNKGGEFLDDEKIARIKKIAGRNYVLEGKTRQLLSDEEVYNLCIRRGTLNEEERSIINNHALVSHKMLSQLPFPKKMRNVASYAAAHHEKIDGTGYPLGLKGDELSLQSRIIAIADVFEALTACDRPYKKGKSLSEALKIMEKMAKDNHIDAELYAFFVKEKVYAGYVLEEIR